MTTPLADRLRAVPDRLEELAAQDLFSGVVHVEHGTEVLLSTAHGRASRRWEVPVRTSTRFDVASVTKLFTAVAVLQQVGLGRLGLDESIHGYVDLEGTAISPAVTVRHLLTHTSGIGDDADEEAGESYEALWVDMPVYAVMQTADFLPQFVHKEPNFAPGEGCRYCNVGYVLLGLALERVTGRTYRDVVRADVFARAGMDRAGFFDRRDPEPDVAEGWEPVRADPEDEGSAILSWRQNIFSYPPIGSPDGGAHCTAADLVRFFDAVRRGELLPPALTEGFLTPQVLHHAVTEPEPGPWATAEVHHAWGLEVEVTAQGSVRSLYKDGVNTGSSAILRHYPAQDVTLAVVASSEDAAWGPIGLLDEIVMETPRPGS
ncbi:serine hydrolase [Actinotalea sp. C106]|uniref:serine hydrolase domain-containing protein n=1 Tax=Actinotalea sp. C106 TaxID=2908644 RepID=UPI0020279EBC|nr:serine hydrolase domain-containing protein [Actinotalea sp. C106]